MLAGLCKYESVIDGTLTLSDIGLMNEMLDVRDENERRIAQAMKEH